MYGRDRVRLGGDPSSRRRAYSFFESVSNELDDREDAVATSMPHNELCEDLVRFHLALNYNDSKAARELLVSAARN